MFNQVLISSKLFGLWDHRGHSGNVIRNRFSFFFASPCHILPRPGDGFRARRGPRTRPDKLPRGPGPGPRPPTPAGGRAGRATARGGDWSRPGPGPLNSPQPSRSRRRARGAMLWSTISMRTWEFRGRRRQRRHLQNLLKRLSLCRMRFQCMGFNIAPTTSTVICRRYYSIGLHSGTS